MWKFISECLKRSPKSKIQDSHRLLTYEMLFEMSEEHGSNLSKILGNKAKCAVLCDSGLNTAIGILACWCAGLVAVPLSKNYGQDHCNKIISLTDPDILLTDNDDCLYRYTYSLKKKLFRGKVTI